MKKELSIPKYKASSSSTGNTLVNIGLMLFAVVVIFAGVSLRGITANYVKNFPVVPANSQQYSSGAYNRGSNAISTISINPDTIVAGGTVYITVDPGLKCAWQRMKVEYWGSDRNSRKECGKGVLKDNFVKAFANADISTDQRGGFEVCETKTIPYITESSFSEGVYAVDVFDYNLNDWVCQPFIVYRVGTNSEDLSSFDISKSILGQR